MLPDDAARGRFIMAVLAYASTGKEYLSDDPIEKMLFVFCKTAIDRDQEKYKNRCLQNKNNIYNYWHGRKNTSEYERIRTNTNNSDMDTSMDMNKEFSSLSAPAAEAASGHRLRTVQPDADKPEDDERNRRPKVIYTR